MDQLKLVIDLSWGSTGKGLLASVLAEQDEPDTLITAFAPNAGHTSFMKDGTRLMHKMLANGITSPKTERILIGPGAVINVEVLVKEIENAAALGLADFRNVYVHENAAVATAANVAQEADFGRIGSTQTGSGAAAIQKIVRDPENSNLARDVIKDKRIQVVTDREYLRVLEQAQVAQIEGAQGFSLSIQHGFWPYVTSRDVSPAQILADCGVPWNMARMTEVIGITRTYPIRVNNKTGTSGPCYEDQREISFAEIGQEVELTTVTKLPRRVFTYSKQQMSHATWVCAPSEMMVNFCNYCSSMEELMEIVDHLNTMTTVRYLGFGPKNEDVLDVNGMMDFTARDAIYHYWERSRA